MKLGIAPHQMVQPIICWLSVRLAILDLAEHVIHMLRNSLGVELVET